MSLNAENTRSQGTSRQVVKESLLTRMNSSNLLTSNLTSVLGHQEIAELIADGIEAKDIEASLAVLLPLYRAEGIEPTASVLMVGIRQLKADARGMHAPPSHGNQPCRHDLGAAGTWVASQPVKGL